MTPEELAIEVNERGSLNRSDIVAVLEYHNDPDSAEVYIQQFLELISFLSSDDRIKVLADLPSYV